MNSETSPHVVLTGDYCSGCGACAFVAGGHMHSDVHGRLRPRGDSAALHAAIDTCCPFGTNGAQESTLAEELFGRHAEEHPSLGRVQRAWAGHCMDQDFRRHGSSGGLGSWIACAMLESGMVEAVVHVQPGNTTGHPLYHYAISHTIAEVRTGAKSRYYPVSLDQVIPEIITLGKPCLVVGLPCFITALRLMMRHHQTVRRVVAYTLGLCCGHLKSARFTELLAWQAGIAPDTLRSVDFRVKPLSPPANRYHFSASDQQGHTVETPMATLLGHDWGQGLLKLKACDYCDDVFAETADITIGDAWLPAYTSDPAGDNIVLTRHPACTALIEQAQAEGRLKLDGLSFADIERSQRAGLWHRRQGLAYRLAQASKRGEWAPPKRTQPGTRHLNRLERRLIDARTELREKSVRHFTAARGANDLTRFRRAMAPYIAAYNALILARRRRASALPGRLCRLIRRVLRV